MSDVFISYSRKDGAFARKLTNALVETGRDIWVDWEDIARGADWLHEIYAGIEAADTFVFIVSQHSLTSEICNYEVAHARKHNKRIIPLILQEIRGEIETTVKGIWFDQQWVELAQENWQALGHLNWIFFHDDSKFDSEFDALVTALETDLVHVKLHTRLLVRAREWETSGNSPSFLLTGEEIDSAEAWQTSATEKDKQPAPTDLHRQYIITSRERDQREKQRITNLRRASVIAGLVGVVAIVLTIVTGINAVNASNNASTAEARANLASTQEANAVAQANHAATNQAESEQIRVTVQDESYRYQMAGQAQVKQDNSNDALVFAFEGVSAEQPPIDAYSVFYNTVKSTYNRLTYTGHGDRISAVAINVDNETVATAGYDHTIQLWNRTTGAEIAILTGHTDHINALAFSPDGRLLVSGSADRTIRLWDVTKQTQVATISGPDIYVSNVTFSPDGKTIASSNITNLVRLWDVAELIEKMRINHYTVLKTVAFSPDGKMIASAGEGSDIKLWDITTGEEIAELDGHKSFVKHVEFSPDSQLLASAGLDDTIRLWDVNTGEELATLTNHTHWVNDVSFHPDGKIVASASEDHTIKLWSTRTYEPLLTLTGHTAGVQSIAFTPDGESLVSVSADETAKVWDIPLSTYDLQVMVNDGVARDILTEQPNLTVTGLAFSPNGLTLASSGPNETIKLWDALTGEERASLPVDDISAKEIAWSPDGNTLASVGLYHITLWDVPTQTMLTILDEHTRPVNTIAFSPDGRLFASASFDGIKLWDVESWSVITTLTTHTDQVNHVKFSPDGSLLASSSADQTIRLWDVSNLDELVATGQSVAILTGGGAGRIAFTSDGRILASGGAGITLWDMETATKITTLGGNSTVTGLAFSPDDSLLVSGGTIRLWDVATYTEIGTLNVPFTGSGPLVFSPDGRQIATGDSAYNVKLWNISSLPLMRQWVQENRYMREFNCDERTRFDMPVQCDPDGNFPTRTPYPTPSPMPTKGLVTLAFTPFYEDATIIAHMQATDASWRVTSTAYIDATSTNQAATVTAWVVYATATAGAKE